jgi:hypothetical protein
VGHPPLFSEHAFDTLRLLDCALAEFDAALGTARESCLPQIGTSVTRMLVVGACYWGIASRTLKEE